MTRLATVDFETYYDSTYSLSKMTMAEYIRDPRFQIIGVSVTYGDDDPTWYSFDSHDGYANVLAPLRDCVAVAHNAMFDMAILNWHLDTRPKIICDTLSMARPIHGSTVGGSLRALSDHYQIGRKGTEVVDAMGKRREDFTPEELAAYGRYCSNDVALTRKLFHILRRHTASMEMKLIDQTVRMFTEPMLELDANVLTECRDVAIAKRELQRAAANVPLTKLRSNPQFAELLKQEGVDPPTKISDRTGKRTYAFAKSDHEFTQLKFHQNPRVRTLVEARLACKTSIDETRADLLLRLADWPYAVPLQYCGATTTWRHSGFDSQNMQNLPKKTRLRHAFRAPKGYRVCAVDSSNIELRVNHTLAGQQDSIEAFRDGRDLYCEFASQLYGRYIDPVEDKASPERFMGKLAHLSLGYGCGWLKFQAIGRQWGVSIDDEEARRIVYLWRDTYAMIPKLWQLGDMAVYRMGTGKEALSIVDPAGLIKVGPGKLFTPPEHSITYPNMRLTDDGWAYDKRMSRGVATVKLYGAKCVENWTQHIARNIIAEQWLKVARRYRVLLQVHDELVFLAPEDEADEAVLWAVKVMSQSPEWWPEIPLAAEGKHGETYGDAK